MTRTLVVDDTTDADAVIFAPTRPPIDQAWLQSCGDIDPGMRIPSAQGSPLSLHSVSKLALRTGGVSNRVLHLPPGEASGEGATSIGVLGRATRLSVSLPDARLLSGGRYYHKSSLQRLSLYTGAVHQRWRDKHGRVELKVAAKDRKYAEAVRLLDNVHMKEVFHR